MTKPCLHQRKREKKENNKLGKIRGRRNYIKKEEDKCSAGIKSFHLVG